MSGIEIKKENYSKQDIVSLLKLKDQSDIAELFKHADNVRQEYMGNIIHVRSILEFSNYCCRNCMYCGIRKGNEKTHRYRLEPDEIINYAIKAEDMGYKTLIMQSGEDFYYDIKKLEQIVRIIKNNTKLKLTLSIGEKTEEEYQRLFDAGADRYLIKHETSDPILYRTLHPDLKYSNRINCLKTLKSIGYETGSGIMVGLPGQTLESVANDILLFKDLNIDMMGIGPYIPHPGTPLGRKHKAAGGYFIPAIGNFDENTLEELIYKVIAITRIVTKRTNIPATTGFNVLNDHDVRKISFKRGANVIMLNITDDKVREYYEIYPQKKDLAKKNAETKEDIIKQYPEFQIL